MTTHMGSFMFEGEKLKKQGKFCFVDQARSMSLMI
jgi:hypothetical protein